MRFSTTATALFLLVFMTGCVSEMVEKHKPRKGPVKEVGWVDTGGGEVRYSTEGWDFVVSLRRSSALRRMKRFCKGLKARIADEFTHQDVDVPYSNDDLSQNMDRGAEHYKVRPFHHILFECEIVPTLLPVATTAQAPIQGNP